MAGSQAVIGAAKERKGQAASRQILMRGSTSHRKSSPQDTCPQGKGSFIILTIRTDKPKAEVGLYKNRTQLAQIKWQAHRELSNTIHKQIEKLLMPQGLSLQRIDGIVCFKGPGSFTGLRIGLSVANALVYAQNIPIVAAGGKNWIQAGLKDLDEGKNDKIVTPEYGSPPNITKPRK